jgi:hypothetical protein
MVSKYTTIEHDGQKGDMFIDEGDGTDEMCWLIQETDK